MSNDPRTPVTDELWEAWEEPPLEYTKKVDQRGGFHAINATWQQWQATKMWGPMGTGWGPTNVVYHERKDPQGNVLEIICEMDLFYDCRRDQDDEPPMIRGLRSGVKYRPGDDCDIKAWTHCISKGLSRLGQCAAIFLGEWDDLPPQVGGSSRPQEARRPAPDSRPSPRPAPADDGYYDEPPAPQAGVGANGPEKTCPSCDNPGVTQKYWKPGERGPDLECAEGCTEEYNGKKRPLRWWSHPKGAK